MQLSDNDLIKLRARCARSVLQGHSVAKLELYASALAEELGVDEFEVTLETVVNMVNEVLENRDEDLEDALLEEEDDEVEEDDDAEPEAVEEVVLVEETVDIEEAAETAPEPEDEPVLDEEVVSEPEEIAEPTAVEPQMAREKAEKAGPSH